MELWSEVRRRVLTGELSKRQARKEYGLHWDTLQKILQYGEPPGYRKKQPREKPVLGTFVALIHEILEADKEAPKKQRHTAKRILERLREKGYQGGRTVVQEEVRRWKRRSAEVFMPLVHRPGEAQSDFHGDSDLSRAGAEGGDVRDVAAIQRLPPLSDLSGKFCTSARKRRKRRVFLGFVAFSPILASESRTRGRLRKTDSRGCLDTCGHDGHRAQPCDHMLQKDRSVVHHSPVSCARHSSRYSCRPAPSR